jgi:hypothetical protein
MLRRVPFVRTDVSEELSASIIRVTTISELGTTLAVTSNRHTLQRNTKWLHSVGFDRSLLHPQNYRFGHRWQLVACGTHKEIVVKMMTKCIHMGTAQLGEVFHELSALTNIHSWLEPRDGSVRYWRSISVSTVQASRVLVREP